MTPMSAAAGQIFISKDDKIDLYTQKRQFLKQNSSEL